MKFAPIRWTAVAAVLTAMAVFDSADTFAQSIPISENPLFSVAAQPPLNMLVVGKDTKLYYEAYNDASDIDGDGALDIGYKPDRITYYGYFNSNVCYTWTVDRFVPTSATANKQCAGTWSGDFLNYATTSRMDALRRVLYGGWRQVDTATDTILQGAYFPQDGHSAGKEYQSIARDGYDISKYTPYAVPGANKYILFATTTVTGNDNAFPNYQAPMLRVLKNTDKRVWNWLSIEGPVAGNKCFTSANTRVDCVTTATTSWDVLPSAFYSGLTLTTWKRLTGTGSPANKTDMDSLFSTNAVVANRCGSGAVTNINTSGGNNNPYSGTNGCTNDNYLTLIQGTLSIPTTQDYRLSIDGDDAVDVFIDGAATPVLGWYGGHGSDRSTAGLDGRSVVRNLTAGNHTISFRHQEGTGDDNWGFLSRTDVPAATRDDFYVRVQSCPASSAALREASCKRYPNGQYKPTGILHDYGETGKMFFGLIGGSQSNNLEGGVLRRNVTNFSEEIDATTGVFKSTVNGIANSLSSLRMIGGGYNSGVTNNLNSDTNWNWANGTGNCPSIGDRAINNGECRMWGNPIAEMMYEALRYFAGAAAPTTRFSSTSSPGSGEDVTMNLHTETWRNPYGTVASGGSGYLSCSKPFETVISDINPSYDGDLPGSPFTGAVTTTNNTPATIAGFNAAAEGQLIWNAEFNGSRKVFIGESAGATDGAPTSKLATSFGNIRGLSPEEPTKGGTYYAASVARFGRNNDINAVAGQQNMSTYSIALASQLPHIEFPVGTAKVTLIPFAKTLSGTFGGGTRKPTNTIVDYYVERIVNLPGQPVDMSPATGNGGLPYAVFRINYEDVEQGNDHDMDAIVRYVIKANADNTVTVRLESEYAAGSADQDMGYVISGTSNDGLYIDVSDTDSTFNGYHALKTPNPVLPGGCAPATHPAACDVKLPLVSERVFTPNAAASDTISLNDPLWYAAKYGAPDPTANDIDNNGVPDNYFLVTNPTNLRSQLDRAFTSILGNSVPVGSASASSQRFVTSGSLAYQASFLITDWTGDLKAFELNSDGSLSATPAWSASSRLPAPASRKVFTSKLALGAFTGIPFKVADLTAAGLNTTLMGSLNTAVYNITDVVAYLLGDQSKETNHVPAGPYRSRTTKIGDILDSTPTVKFLEGYGYQNLPASVNGNATGSAGYQAFVSSKSTVPVVFVGANDGMLHAFNGSNTGGDELFSYIPNAVISKLNQLVVPAYTHTYFVDGTPRLGDVYDGSWKTLLIGATGPGARSVFGLDVTNPSSFTASNVLWEFNDQLDNDMGVSIGVPSLPTVTADGLWVTAFGNGYNSARNHAELFILDAKSGNKLSEIDTNTGGNSTSVNCVRATGPTDCPNGLSSAVMIDSDLDGTGDTIYAGDYLGNLWKFTCTPDTIALSATHKVHSCTTPWQLGLGGRPLIKAQDSSGLRQPITSGVYAINNPLGGTIVYFGTGRYLTVDDGNPTSSNLVNSIYGVWDNPNNVGTTLTRGDLQQQQITGYNASTGYVTVTSNLFDYEQAFPIPATHPNSKMGWYLDLVSPSGSDPMTSERVIAAPAGILGSLLVNAFRPTGDVCVPGGENTFFELNLLNGSAAFSVIPGGSGTVPPAGTGGFDLGAGSPLGSPNPVISIPGQPGIPSIGCPASNPNCATANPAYCTPGVPGYPQCAKPCWCNDAATCTIADAPVGCAAGTEPAFPYGGSCKCDSEQCKWFNPGTPVGNLIACRISWRQLR